MVLRVTVTRESASETQPIAEVVIGKFAGSEQRGGYAARVFEPPSPYSDGVDACFTVRGHERYQPAFALVASVLQAWREGRVDAVGEGLRAALVQASRPLDATSVQPPGAAGHPGFPRVGLPDAAPAALVEPDSPSADVAVRPASRTVAVDGVGPLEALLVAAGALVSGAAAGASLPSPEAVRAAHALLTKGHDPALEALASAVVAVAER